MNFLRLFSTKNLSYLGFDLIHISAVWQKLIQFNLSDIGEGIAEVQLKEWHVKTGDRVNEFDKICDVQSDKASVTITSRYSGVVKKLHFKPDDIAKVGQPLVDIEIEMQNHNNECTNSRAQISEFKTASQEQDIAYKNSSQSGKIRASPVVRRIIRENQLNPLCINGTGPNGRILKEDVLHLINGCKYETSQSTKTFKIDETYPTKTEGGISISVDTDMGQKVVPILGYTRAMIKSMSEALTIPHFGYGDEIIVNELMEAKEALTRSSERKGLKISYIPFIVKATSLALSEYPILNSSLDDNKQNLYFKNSHNISLAMDTPNGLAVPNLKNCQQKNIWQIALELKELMQRGKNGRFSKEDLANGTFTLSNIGSIGGTFLNPVIMPPQVAIGAIGKIRKVPRVDDHDDQLVVRNVMNVFWAADHRVIDGATLARFSNRWKEFLENPVQMLAELR